ncbi:hypothetical protein KAK06_12905 [Ideonella sp. 4Y11]|uniref:Uncharacterized protein n=1 Tax=Ideonella aquatica TaxID=2824119 RepID=A0A940YI27_9BURK|nr:choice-of-anchor X domain-containing protein [Ideonella aquatica]MBQ0959844.1 hypothetical protein [Ideonella aquatica]
MRPIGWALLAAGLLAALWWWQGSDQAPPSTAALEAAPSVASSARSDRPAPTAPASAAFSGWAPAQRDDGPALAHEQLQRAERALASYRAATRYPPEARPITEHPDQVQPFAPISADYPLRLRGSAPVAGVRLQTTQERVFVSGQETVAFSIAAVDEQGRRLPLLITRSVLFDAPDPRAASGRSPVALPFADDGQGADAQAGDGVWSARAAPAAMGFADYAGTLRLLLELSQDGRRGEFAFELVYEPQVPAQWAGVREAVQDGSLVFALGLQVAQPGRYLISARLDDAQGQPFALLQFNEELGSGAQQARLVAFGKLLRDGQPAMPLRLRDVEGFLLHPDRHPDRAMLPRLAGVVHTSRVYPLSRFSEAEWQSEERQRYLDELQRDVDRARRELAGP